MRLAIIGGGSSYTPELLSGFIAHPIDRLSITLHDIDSKRVQIVAQFCQRMLQHAQMDIQLDWTVSLQEALSGADLVVAQLRVGGQEARHEDILMGLEHGLLGQETTGVGGMAKALRTIPVMLDLARQMDIHCPEAWLINFTNPSGIITEALLRYGRQKVIGLCNVPIELHMDLAEYFDCSPSQVQLDWVGLNHLGWVRSVLVNGEEKLAHILHQIEYGDLAHLTEVEYPKGFLSALNMIPSYYLRFFYAHDQAVAEIQQANLTRAQVVQSIETKLFDLYQDPQQVILPDLLKQRGGAWYSRLAIQVIHALQNKQPSIHIVNTLNQGCIAQLPDNASVEVACEISQAGVKPLAIKPVEDSIIGLIQQVKSYERLTIEAAMQQSAHQAYLALMANPLVPHVTLAEKILHSLKQRQHI